MIVYSPSGQSLSSDQSVHKDLLQYLYSRAQMDENANPRLLAVYEGTNKVPVSLTVDGLQPSTAYLIFVQVEMLHQVGATTVTHVHVYSVYSLLLIPKNTVACTF